MAKFKSRLKKVQLAFLISILIIFLVNSCISQNKLTYIQENQRLGDELNIQSEVYKLRPGDILHIRIMSDDPESYDVFNLDGNRQFYNRSGEAGDQMMYLYGYTIDPQGEIRLPVIGTISMAGLDIYEARKIVQERAEKYIIDATISVKIVNWSITVLGEVLRPGKYYIYDNDFTILDALGLAGDFTDYGNRKIHIIRKTDQGVTFHRYDITKRESMTSGLYYLQPDDVIYVEPLLAKRFGFAQFPFSIFFSAITTTLLLISFIK
jgi:polysaccharide biosynthesis/export protein